MSEGDNTIPRTQPSVLRGFVKSVTEQGPYYLTSDGIDKTFVARRTKLWNNFQANAEYVLETVIYERLCTNILSLLIEGRVVEADAALKELELACSNGTFNPYRKAPADA